MDELQEWLEGLHFQVKLHKEGLEYHAHLLDELFRPWPLECAPQALQDVYSQECANKEKQEKKSKFDEDLQSVDKLLQKARLLHERKTGKPKSKSLTQDKEIPQLETKFAPSRGHSSTDKVGRPRSAGSGKGPLKKKSGRKLPKKEEYKGLEVPKEHKNNTEKHSSVDAADNLTSVQDDQKELDHLKKIAVENQGTGKIDFEKVKVDPSEFMSELEIPPKIKKLLQNHEKLKNQSRIFLNNRVCTQEAGFIRNVAFSTKDDSSKTHDDRYRTLQAANAELYRDISVCNNLIMVLKHGKKFESMRNSKTRWSAQQEMYFEDKLLKLVEELAVALTANFRDLARHQVVDISRQDLEVREIDLLPRLSSKLDDLSSMSDHLPYPAGHLSYQSSTEAVSLVRSQLNCQCLVIEKNIVGRTFNAYIALIKELMDSKQDRILDSETVAILQNAFGLLAQADILLPAYVSAE